MKRKRNSGRKAGGPAAAGPSARRVLLAWGPVVLLEAGILFVSTRSVGQPPLPWTWGDKLAHFAEYGLLGAVLFRALRITGLRPDPAVALTLVLVAVLGAGDEWLQSFVPMRNSSPADWAADLTGGAAAAFFLRSIEGRLPPGWIRWTEPGDEKGRA